MAFATLVLFCSLFAASFALTTDLLDIKPCGPSCPSGWFRYKDSCYLYVRRKETAPSADAYCRSQQASLVVFQDLDEMNVVQEHMALARWTWIGLQMHPFDRDAPLGPKWTVAPGMNTEILPWLNKATGHGHVATANCVSYFKPDSKIGHYVNFYPCTYMHYYVCEKATQ